MTTPLQFYRIFRDLLKEQGVRALLTSGMACVEYGIQETTKDTDWIIHPDEFEKLVALLCHQEKGLTGANWRISYRGIFGAPLDRQYHLGGWTSHLAIWSHALSPEEHLDFFGKPPRVDSGLWLRETGSIASRSTVAAMKKTDREKDWPFVNSLAAQDWFSGSHEGLLHLRDIPVLRKAWPSLTGDQRQDLVKKRPLLGRIEESNDIVLERLLIIEKNLWERVNRLRYQIYQTEWKSFYRRWQKDSVGRWPTSESFDIQHHRVLNAAREYSLPVAPLDAPGERKRVYSMGCDETRMLLSVTDSEMGFVQPAQELILP